MSTTKKNEKLRQTTVSSSAKHTVKKQSFFTNNIWCELKRYSVSGEFLGTVTCTEENLINLYNSQFIGKTVYGKIFFYEPDVD